VLVLWDVNESYSQISSADFAEERRLNIEHYLFNVNNLYCNDYQQKDKDVMEKLDAKFSESE
jgi:neutral trehalase